MKKVVKRWALSEQRSAVVARITLLPSLQDGGQRVANLDGRWINPQDVKQRAIARVVEVTRVRNSGLSQRGEGVLERSVDLDSRGGGNCNIHRNRIRVPGCGD